MKKFTVWLVLIVAMLSCLTLSGCADLIDALNLDYSYLWGGNSKDKAEVTQPQQAETLAPSEETAEIPNCVGLSSEEALQALGDANVAASITYAFSEHVPVGFVISQSNEGDVCVLIVSKGPAQTPEYTQKVVVSAYSGSSYGELALYNWENGAWKLVFSCDATVGKNGISSNYGEGKKRTPAGEFKLGVALSAKNISNSGWPFYKTTTDTCIVDDPNHIDYNTIQSISDLDDDVSYDPVGKTLSKTSNVLIYIEHNGDGLSREKVVAGEGSVITICGKTTAIKPTAGCVDIASSDMNKLLSKLDYDRNPIISISNK